MKQTPRCVRLYQALAAAKPSVSKNTESNEFIIFKAFKIFGASFNQLAERANLIVWHTRVRFVIVLLAHVLRDCISLGISGSQDSTMFK